MLQQQQTRTNSRGEAYVIGPTGAPLTKNDLPPPNTGRWVIRRKAEVVAAVRARRACNNTARPPPQGRSRREPAAPRTRARPVFVCRARFLFA